jgi:hypothetical protein
MRQRKMQRHDIEDGDHEVVGNREVLHVPVYAQDGMRQAIARHAATLDGEALDASQHRPGFRVADQAAQDRREAARDAYVRDLCKDGAARSASSRTPRTPARARATR